MMIYLALAAAFGSGAIVGWLARGHHEEFCNRMDRDLGSGL